MFCPKCGTSNPEGAKFCMSCQFALGTSADAAALAPGEIVYAGFWERFAALFIDNLLVMAIMVPVFFVFGLVAGLSGAGNPDALNTLSAITWLLILVLSGIYYILMESGERGATFGKRALKLRVVDTAGNRISKARATGRWAAHALSNLTLYIGYLIQPFTGRKQALHDLASGTLVVKTEKSSNTLTIVIAVVAMTLTFIVVGGILAAVAIPAYQDYVVKAQANVAVQVGNQATRAVEQYYEKTGRIPPSLAKTKAQITLPDYLSGIEVNPDTGEVQVTFNNKSSRYANKSLLFTPTQAPDGSIVWHCSSEDIPANSLPRSCR